MYKKAGLLQSKITKKESRRISLPAALFGILVLFYHSYLQYALNRLHLCKLLRRYRRIKIQQRICKITLACVAHVMDIRISKHIRKPADHTFYVLMADRKAGYRLTDTKITVWIVDGIVDISVFQEIA